MAIFFPLNYLGTSKESQLTINIRVNLVLSVVSLRLIDRLIDRSRHILIPIPCYLDYCRFIVLKSETISSPNFLLFNILLAILSSLHFHKKFRITLFILLTKRARIGIATLLSPLIHKHGISCPLFRSPLICRFQCTISL